MSIPVIDLHGNRDAGNEVAARTAKELYQALSSIGFAYIAGHGVDPAIRESAFAASKEFHASDIKQKMSIGLNEFHRGYMPMASESIRTSSIAQVRKPNLSESLMFMHELADDDPDLLAGKPLQGPNQWPTWVPGFRERIQSFIAEVDHVGRYLLKVIAISLDLPKDYFDPFFERPTTFLRLLHYPPQPVDDKANFGSAPHSDYGFITLLTQDDSGGLQVRPRGVGQPWIEAPPMGDAFVLNVGDMLARWTNNIFMSTPHRVVNYSGHDRYSMPYFLDAGMDTVVECLPTCTDAGNPPRFAPIRYGDQLMEHMNKNYDFRQPAKATA